MRDICGYGRAVGAGWKCSRLSFTCKPACATLSICVCARRGRLVAGCTRLIWRARCAGVTCGCHGRMPAPLALAGDTPRIRPLAHQRVARHPVYECLRHGLSRVADCSARRDLRVGRGSGTVSTAAAPIAARYGLADADSRGPPTALLGTPYPATRIEQFLSFLTAPDARI